MQNVKEGMKTDFLPTVLGQALPRHWISAIQNCGACRIEELRLHAGRIARTVDRGLTYPTDLIPRAEELAEVLKRLCGGSLYAYANTINQGYLTVEGGIRIGVCGSAALEGGQIIGVHNVTGLIIRIPHAVKLSTSQIADIFFAGLLPRGILFYSLPGVGKTTVLRSLARELSSPHRGLHTVAVDTREELSSLLSGENLDLDVLFGSRSPCEACAPRRCCVTRSAPARMPMPSFSMRDAAFLLSQPRTPPPVGSFCPDRTCAVCTTTKFSAPISGLSASRISP